MAVPVDPQNRLRDLTPPREIEARIPEKPLNFAELLNSSAFVLQGWTGFDFSGRGDRVPCFTRFAIPCADRSAA